MSHSTTFNDDAAQACDFAEAVSVDHIVDLNGAFAGKPVNAEVAAIAAAVDLPVQLGGGIRSMDTIARWLGQRAGMILGTAASRTGSCDALRSISGAYRRRYRRPGRPCCCRRLGRNI